MSSIFMSSTFVDFLDVRRTLSCWLSAVYGADVTIMETLGGDTIPPDVTSVKNVRHCDLFIGMYAHRYGAVDVATGKSITELELDEAERSHSAGAVKDILLYLHDETAPWPAAHQETSHADKLKLERLRARAKAHTPSYFLTADDLLLTIMRDVHRKLTGPFQTSSSEIDVLAALMRTIYCHSLEILALTKQR